MLKFNTRFNVCYECHTILSFSFVYCFQDRVKALQYLQSDDLENLKQQNDNTNELDIYIHGLNIEPEGFSKCY